MRILRLDLLDPVSKLSIQCTDSFRHGIACAAVLTREENAPKGEAIKSPMRQITSTIDTTVLPPAIMAASRLRAAARIARSALPAACAVFCTEYSACPSFFKSAFEKLSETEYWSSL